MLQHIVLNNPYSRRGLMSTVMPQSELLRKAITFISEERDSGKAVHQLVDEAAMRFNLSPKDTQYLTNFFKDPDK